MKKIILYLFVAGILSSCHMQYARDYAAITEKYKVEDDSVTQYYKTLVRALERKKDIIEAKGGSTSQIELDIATAHSDAAVASLALINAMYTERMELAKKNGDEERAAEIQKMFDESAQRQKQREEIEKQVNAEH